MFENLGKLKPVKSIEVGVENGRELTTYFAAGDNPFFQADPGLALWTWTVFFLLLAILYKFAWKPILKTLDEREGRIQESLDNAEKIEESLKKTQEDNEAVLREARHEGQNIIRLSREVSEKEKIEIKKQAEEEAKILLEKARHTIEQERKLAVEKIREEAVRLSLEVAGKVLEENLDNDKNYQISKKYLGEIIKF